MLEQLQQSLEPILETYGLWLALGLFFLVLVPTLVLFFLRIQQRQGLNTQLQDLLDASGVLYSQLSGLDHSLHQYLAQAETYTGKTQIQVQPLLAPLSENLAQLHRCKVQIKEWEADLVEQDAETAQQTWLTLEKEAQNLISTIEKTEAFFKRLSEVETALQNQLRQIQDLLAPYQQEADVSAPLNHLKNRLSLFEGPDPAADPLTDLEGIRQLLQDAHQWVETEKQAQLAAASAHLPDEEPAKPAEQADLTQAEPVQEMASAEMPPEDKTEQETEFPTDFSTEVVPQTETPQAEVLHEPVSSRPVNEAMLIDQVLDAALEEAPTHQAETREEAVEELLETNLTKKAATDNVQTASDLPVAPSEDETAQPHVGSDIKPEEMAPKTEKTQTAAGAKLQARLQSEADNLAQQQARLLPHLEEIRDTLNERFVPALWEASATALKRALYRAEEAALMIKLAHRLFMEPAAPAHRVLLNLQRSAEKWPEIEKLYAQLQHQHQELELAAEQTLQDCKNLSSMLELPDFDDKKHSNDYQKAQSLLGNIIAQFESDQALDLNAAQMELAWVANCIQSWKTPSNPEEESMVAL